MTDYTQGPFYFTIITVDDAVAENNRGVRTLQEWRGWSPTPEDSQVKDGPKNSRLKIIDYNPETNELLEGAKIKQPSASGHPYRFDTTDFPNLLQVSVFATVLKTLDLFESKEALGRRLSWAFGSDQLKVYPRARLGKNAYYSREEKSLVFLHFPSKYDSSKIIQTAASPDIVAHEAGHAILDAVAPDLYDAVTPESLAIHEAIADLTAIFLTFEMDSLREAVLSKTGGQLRTATEFGSIAEEFGFELAENGSTFYLRNLLGNSSLNPDFGTLIPYDKIHDLSVVLSGSIYAALISEFERDNQQRAVDTGKSKLKLSGLSLFVTAQKVRRILYRALDYLPPSDASFLDIARAMLVTDYVAYPDSRDSHFRAMLIHEFIKRGIGKSISEFAVTPVGNPDLLSGMDLQEIIEDDDVVRDLIDAHRDLFLVPDDADYDLRSRTITQKSHFSDGEWVDKKELIIKLAWLELDKPLQGDRSEEVFEVLRGTTILVDWDTRRIRFILTNYRDPNHRAADRQSRLDLVRTLVQQGYNLADLTGRGRLGPHLHQLCNENAAPHQT